VAVLRGNHTLLTVPVPTGARQVELVFRSATFRTGKWLTLGSLAVVAVALGAGLAADRRRRA
jgi:hypothetical protein